jgi:heme A synthase
MIYFAGIIGIIILASMIYMALRKESNFATRIACLIALAIMILSIIVCLFIIFMGGHEPVDESVLIVGSPVRQAPKEKSNLMVMLFLAIILVILFVLITLMSLREQHKIKAQEDKQKSSQEISDF